MLISSRHMNSLHPWRSNHGSRARNPKLDSRQVKYMSMTERPLIRMMLQNSACTICLNEAGAEKSKDLIKLFIRFGYKGIVLKSWRPIACFVRGGKQARVELLARHISTKSHTGVRHLECSDAILESRRIALIPTTTPPHPTAWQPPDRTCLLIGRSTLE